MRKIKDYISKPSEAITAMKDGLLNQSKRSDFKIDMDTFGKVNNDNICFGCAATCTIQELRKVNFTSKNIEDRNLRASVLETDFDDLRNFEYAINQARQGKMFPLFVYFNIPLDKHDPDYFDYRIYLGKKWMEEINNIDHLINLLKESEL